MPSMKNTVVRIANIKVMMHKEDVLYEIINALEFDKMG